MMLRHIALLAVSLALLAACGHREKYSSYEQGPKHKGAAPFPKAEDQSVKPVRSSDGCAERRLLESLPKDGQYIIVTGDVLGQLSEELDGRLLRIDAILVWLNPGAEAGMSTFETRDGRFEFDVSWIKVTSSDDMEQIIRIKERIYKGYYECKFRLYGRWAHEDGLLSHVRELTIDKWECVEW